MSSLIDNTEKAFEEFNFEIKATMSIRNLDASGAASNSLRVTSDSDSVTSLGVFYLEFLNRGRPPGKFPPIAAIEKWLSDKGLDIPAFLVARKIAREGTAIYKNRITKGLQLEPKIEALKQNINENAAKWAKNDLLLKIKGINSEITKTI